jgi:hypothetical protein
MVQKGEAAEPLAFGHAADACERVADPVGALLVFGIGLGCQLLNHA